MIIEVPIKMRSAFTKQKSKLISIQATGGLIYGTGRWAYDLGGGLISVGRGAYKQYFIVQSPKLDLTIPFHMKLFAYILLNSRLNYSNAFLL